MIIGDTMQFRFVFTDRNGHAVNVAGRQVKLFLKRRQTDTDAQAFYAVSAEPTDPASGIVDLVVPSNSSASFTAGNFYYHFVRAIGSQVVTLSFGTVKIVHA